MIQTAFQRLTNILDRPRTIFYIMVLALALRSGALWIFQDKPIINDAIAYHNISLVLLEDQERSYFWPPGLPLYLSLMHRIWGASQLSSRVAMLVLSLMLIMCIYLVIKNLGSTRTANLAAGLFAVYPNYIYQSVTPLTQPLTALLLVVTFFLVIKTVDLKDVTSALGTGLTVGYLTLVRASSVLFVFVMPIYIWFKTKRLMLVLASLLAVGIPVGAWTYYAYQNSGRFVFINDANTTNFFRGNNPWTPLYRTWWFGTHTSVDDGVPEAYRELNRFLFSQSVEQRDRAFMDYTLKYIFERPDLFIIRTLSRIRCYFAFDTFTAATVIKDYKMGIIPGLIVLGFDALVYMTIMLLMILALFQPGGILQSRLTIIALGMALLYALPYFISWAHPTYHFPVMPLLMIASLDLVDGKHLPQNGLLNKPRRKWGIVLALAVLLYIQIEWVVVSFSRLGGS
ncbi:MAG: glycosyltransferase family 39 protein [Calditrichota bacterium]